MSQLENWIPVYQSNDEFDIEVIKSHLNQMGVESVILNHQDSMLKMFNETSLKVNLLVHPDDVEKAKKYIEEHKKA